MPGARWRQGESWEVWERQRERNKAEEEADERQRSDELVLVRMCLCRGRGVIRGIRSWRTTVQPAGVRWGRQRDGEANLKVNSSFLLPRSLPPSYNDVGSSVLPTAPSQSILPTAAPRSPRAGTPCHPQHPSQGKPAEPFFGRLELHITRYHSPPSLLPLLHTTCDTQHARHV